MKRLINVILLGVSTVALASCGDSAKKLLATGSLFGNAPKPPAAAIAAKPDPLARPIQVGWVSARATKCGFFFNPAKLKQQYLAAEAATGLPLDQLNKLSLTYEYSRKSTALKIAKAEGYCSDARAKAIRTDLQRHLAGDYSPTPKVIKVKEQSTNWLSDLGDSAPEKFDAGKILYPND